MDKSPTKEIVFPPPLPFKSKVEVVRRPVKENVSSSSPVEPKVGQEKRPERERVDPPLSRNKEEDKNGDWDMI